MRILDIAMKDLSQILRDKKSLLFLVAMPVIFTIFMGFAYRGSSSNNKSDTRLTLAVVDSQPDSLPNKMLLARLESSKSLKTVRLEENAALQALRKNEVDGVLLIPSDLAGAGTTTQLTLLTATAGSAQEQSLYQLLRVPLTQLMSAVQIAHMSQGLTGKPDEFVPALELAWDKWEIKSQLHLVRIEQATSKSNDWTGGNPYNQASPGILVQFAIFGLVTSAQILVQERKSRTLQRLMTTACAAWEIVAGHLLAMFTLTFTQTALLVVFGQFALKVDYLREPLGTLLLSVGLGLWVASLGLLIGIMAKGEDQVILFSMISMFMFSALGGTWFPLEAAGGAFAAVGHLLPSAWAMNGLQNLLIRGLGLESVWKPAGMLLLYALGFFGLAVWRFRKVEM